MKRDNRVDGYINLRIKFMDTFSEDWDDDDIIEYIKKHIEDYLSFDEDDIDNIDVDIDTVTLDTYGSDDLYGI